VLNIVLYQPEIPPNTGNIIRLCANSGASLHLVRPLGFDLDDRQLRRAGLDYHEYARLTVHDSIEAYCACVATGRIYACSTRGRTRHTGPRYQRGDTLIFGSESKGLPDSVLRAPLISDVLRIPMQPDSRSINLSNAVAIVLYEAWRQLGFEGAC
jgi:tRNA (cytidine/uridine-2'-O-)-methyltransferase